MSGKYEKGRFVHPSVLVEDALARLRPDGTQVISDVTGTKVVEPLTPLLPDEVDREAYASFLSTAATMAVYISDALSQRPLLVEASLTDLARFLTWMRNRPEFIEDVREAVARVRVFGPLGPVCPSRQVLEWIVIRRFDDGEGN